MRIEFTSSPKKKKTKKKPYQHSKRIVDLIVILMYVMGLSSIAVAWKNGFSMDGVFNSMCIFASTSLGSNFCKSYFEKKEETKMRLEYLKQGLESKYEESEEI